MAYCCKDFYDPISDRRAKLMALPEAERNFAVYLIGEAIREIQMRDLYRYLWWRP